VCDIAKCVVFTSKKHQNVFEDQTGTGQTHALMSVERYTDIVTDLVGGNSYNDEELMKGTGIRKAEKWNG